MGHIEAGNRNPRWVELISLIAILVRKSDPISSSEKGLLCLKDEISSNMGAGIQKVDEFTTNSFW